MKRIQNLVLLALVAVLPLSASGQTAGGGQHRFTGLHETYDDVVVPVPSEIFRALDKLGEPNWHLEEKTPPDANTSNRTSLALAFGSAVAEGFIAVQAKDKKGVEEVGRKVLRIAEALGLRDAVLQHTQAILNAADRKDWKTIRRELDKTQKTVRSVMERLQDGPLAQCVSVGGWLRGTEAATSVIMKTYNDDRAEILQQPELAKHFKRTLSGLPRDVRNHPVVGQIIGGLGTVQGLMSGNGPVPKDGVSTIHEICSKLNRTIFKAAGN